MSLAYPLWLLLMPVVLWLCYRKSSQGALRVPSLALWQDARGGRGRYLFVVPLLYAFGCSFLLVALARPQAGFEQSVEVKEGIAIEMLVDVSSSMDMKLAMNDGSSARSRMDVAKELVVTFILGDGDGLAGRTSDLIGLISFARYADTRSPLTSGHAALAQIVSNLTIQERPNEDGTAYGDALALAAARLHQLDDITAPGSAVLSGAVASKVIVLLTDGENNSGHHLPEEAGGLAKKWGIKVYAISLGDGRGTAESYSNLTDAERILDHIATETGGIFRQANDYQSLQSVYQEISQLERTTMKTRQLDRVQEWFWLPLLAGLCCWLLALVVESTWLRTAP